MKVVLVNGSPNKSGCTYTALCEIKKTLESDGIYAEIFHIGSSPVATCTVCKYCRENGKCVFDDAVNEFREKYKSFDGYIFGSPVHYASASSSITAFMDRLFYSGAKADMRLKPAAAIVSARRGGTTAALDQLNKYFTISEMPVISSKYWNMVHGSNPEDVLKDEEGLATMRTLAHNMAYYLKCIDMAKKNGITPPEPETPVFTNFIR